MCWSTILQNVYKHVGLKPKLPYLTPVGTGTLGNWLHHLKSSLSQSWKWFIKTYGSLRTTRYSDVSDKKIMPPPKPKDDRWQWPHIPIAENENPLYLNYQI